MRRELPAEISTDRAERISLKNLEPRWGNCSLYTSPRAGHRNS